MGYEPWAVSVSVGGFGFWIVARLNGGWLVHYKEARQQIKIRDKGRK
jgi:hypothetical protein